MAALLSGYAYQTQPNEPIVAGATGTGNPNSESIEPTSEMFTAPAMDAKPATLGALALGSAGLDVWRRP